MRITTLIRVAALVRCMNELLVAFVVVVAFALTASVTDLPSGTDPSSHQVWTHPPIRVKFGQATVKTG